MERALEGVLERGLELFHSAESWGEAWISSGSWLLPEVGSESPPDAVCERRDRVSERVFAAHLPPPVHETP